MGRISRPMSSSRWEEFVRGRKGRPTALDPPLATRIRRLNGGWVEWRDSVRYAVERRRELARPLTIEERRAAAVLISQPTHGLTISSVIEDPAEHSEAFTRFRKRIDRHLGRPWVYVAVPAREKNAKRFHLHCLHWEYIPGGSLRKHSRGSGLGVNPYFERIADQSVFDQGDQVLYALAQNEPLFGSTHHRRHRPPPKHSKVFRCPKDKTLDAQRPELLSAFQRAENQSISDLELLSMAGADPFFNRRLCGGAVLVRRQVVA